ncbi:hypothetical protein FNV43_RR25188 [Rhamnella rubrinervis]|uniref:Uncharacterized protein n=1 Tax=Rhamnella rubrinervis TaxID=2594499 RepID=A0A8K0DUL7_9ROSA|nr:hypothetical protein FNV43_RR25188 [Rhamnella rubrinervis]
MPFPTISLQTSSMQLCLSKLTPFRKLISDLISEQHGHPPLCIIADNFLAWCADVAREYGVFSALFCGGGAFGFTYFYSLLINLPHGLRNTAKSDEITSPDFPEVSSIHVTQLSELIRLADGKDLVSKFYGEVLLECSKSDGILFNTVEDLEKAGLTYFRRKIGKFVWSVGPINLSNGNPSGVGKEAGISSDMCIKWLDTKST